MIFNCIFLQIWRFLNLWIYFIFILALQSFFVYRYCAFHFLVFIFWWINLFLNILLNIFNFLFLFYFLLFYRFFFLYNHFRNFLLIDLLILILQIFGFSLFLLLLLDTLIWFLNGLNLFFLTLWLIGKWFLFLIITKIFFRIIFGFIILINPCYVQSYLLKFFIDCVILILILSSHIKRFHLINLVWVLVLVAIVNYVIFLVVIGWAKSILISALSQSGIETQILFQIVDLVGFLNLLEVHHKIFELEPVIFKPSVSQLE